MKIKITTPEGNIRTLPDCSIYKGRVVQIIKIGVGTPEIKSVMFNGEGEEWEEYKHFRDGYRVFFNSYLLKRDNLLEKAQEDAKTQGWTAELVEKWQEYLFTLGKNEGGYLVECIDSLGDERTFSKQY